MSYTLKFTDQTVDPIGKAPITVAAGTANSIATSLGLTGKGAGNVGGIQQENLIHILENFASATEPANPTVGQTWFDTSKLTLKILVDKSPVIWKSLGGIQITDGSTPPTPAALGDIWFERTGPATGFLYTYTGLGRYPTTDTTIGGWEQIYPIVNTAAGRDEYDAIAALVEGLAGDPVGAYGCGAIGRSLPSLTNFGALDLDLRQKYAVLSATTTDANVLVSPANDFEITPQAVSRNLFLFDDSSSASDSFIAGQVNNNPSMTVPGQVYIDGVLNSLPIEVLNIGNTLEDAYILYRPSAASGSKFVAAQRLESGQWQYDSGAPGAFVNFTPADEVVIGVVSTFRDDDNTILPSTKSATMWAHGVKIVGAKTTHLKVEPNSQDWDLLLSTARWALNRLDLPANFQKAIAAIPFVQDGRQAPQVLLDLATSDITSVRYPSAARRSRRAVGTITQVQNFTETVNAINAGTANRFSIKGINGATGTNPSFGSTIATTNWASASKTLTSGVGSFGLRFRFNDFTERSRFLFSGGAIEISIAHAAGVTAADTNLRALIAQSSTFRLTANQTRIFGPSLPLTMSKQTSNIGIWNANAAGMTTTTQTLGGVSLTITVARDNNESFIVSVAVNGGGALGGTTSVSYKVIGFTDQWNIPLENVFGAPLAYLASDVDPI